MPIYDFSRDGVTALPETTFTLNGWRERFDLQPLLRERIEIIAPETMVIAEEFGEWEDAKRRIDLLALDRNANLVVVELKRDEDWGLMELQAVRYAAMISTMTFERVVSVYEKHLEKIDGQSNEARVRLLDFLGWEEPDEDHFAQDVRIVLAAREFSRELTTAVLWLNERGADIRCVRMKPYLYGDRLLVDVQQIIPLPEVEEYQVQFREKAQKERQTRASAADFTRYDVTIGAEKHEAMWKRQAIFLVCKRLCEAGVAPEDIAPLFAWRTNRVWYSVDGTLDAAQFKNNATEEAEAGGPAFSAIRWFCDDGELIHVNGKTYAFSNQWGAEGWRKAMTILKQSFSAHAIDFFPTK